MVDEASGPADGEGMSRCVPPVQNTAAEAMTKVPNQRSRTSSQVTITMTMEITITITLPKMELMAHTSKADVNSSQMPPNVQTAFGLFAEVPMPSHVSEYCSAARCLEI